MLPRPNLSYIIGDPTITYGGIPRLNRNEVEKTSLFIDIDRALFEIYCEIWATIAPKMIKA